MDTSAKLVCEDCLTGWTVPVFRDRLQKWEFGMVEGYDSSTLQHSLRFMDEDVEWIHVETTAFAQYIDHCKLQLLENNRHYGSSFPQDQQGVTSTSAGKESLFDYASDFRFDKFSRDQMDSAPHRSGYQFCTPDNSPEKQRDNIKESWNNTESGERRSRQVYLGTAQPPPAKRAKTTGDSPSSKSPSESSSSECTKYNHRSWTAEEDALLLETIASHGYQLRWSLIAKAIPGRTGKQCRERYLNHLTPSLKLANWSMVEDALIFRLFYSQGSKWAMMAKVLRGRTDNSIKNRYHHLKRRLEREMQAINSSCTPNLKLLIDQLQQSTLLKRFIQDTWMIKYVACRVLKVKSNNGDFSASPSEMLVEASNEDDDDESSSLGPFCEAKAGEFCSRCGLCMPSAQTGLLVAESSGWCETCCHISACISGNLLRVIHQHVACNSEML